MKLLISSTLLFVAITVINTKELEKGPQTFTNADVNASTTQDSPQKQQKRLAMKEIIMYLTPTQIKSLQSGLAYITSQPLAQNAGSGLNQEREYLYNLRNPNEVTKEVENLQNLKAVEESHEQSLPLSHKIQEQQLFYPDLARLKTNDQSFGQQEKELTHPTYQWIPYSQDEPKPIASTNFQSISLNNQNKEEWNPILGYDSSNPKILPSLQPLQDLDILSSPEKRLPLNYAPNFSSHQNIREIELELQLKNEMEKQRALAEIEAIVSQNQAIKKHVPLPSYEHIAVPLPFFPIKSLYSKDLSPSLPSSFFYSSKNIDKQHY